MVRLCRIDDRIVFNLRPLSKIQTNARICAQVSNGIFKNFHRTHCNCTYYSS